MSLSSDRLQGKVCVVTGAAKSIGFGIAQKFAEQGARTVLIDIDPAVRESAKSLADRGLPVWGYVLDITDRAAVLACFDEIAGTAGSVYCLVNVAGVVSQCPFTECTEAEFERDFRVNVFGAAWCCQGALASMLPAKQGGRIISFSSKSGKTGSALMVPYSAAKGAIIAMTQALAYEYAREQITVNCICPGPIRSAITERIPEEHKTIYARRRTALGRYGDPEEVAHMTLSLCLPAASFLTGAVIPVDGGLMARNA